MSGFQGVWSLTEHFQQINDDWDNTDYGRGIFAGGDGASMRNSIRYFSLESTGNTIDFGDLSAVRQRFGNSGSSSTRGIFAGGRDN